MRLPLNPGTVLLTSTKVGAELFVGLPVKLPLTANAGMQAESIRITVTTKANVFFINNILPK